MKKLILSALLSFLLTTVACQISTKTTWSYEQFMQAIDQNQVEKVNISDDRTQALIVTKTGETAHVSLPNDPNLLPKLSQADIDVSVLPARDTDNVLGRVISTLLIPGVILLLTQGFWIWMLIDCATRESPAGNTKLVWILIILLANCLGAVIYFLARRQQRLQELGH